MRRRSRRSRLPPDRTPTTVLPASCDRSRSAAGDRVGLVGGVDVAQALVVADGLAVAAGLVEVAAVLGQLGAEGPHGGDLVGVVALGHDEDAAHAEESAGVGERLAVVAGGAA